MDENDQKVFGLTLQDKLPDDAIPIDCIVIVKYLSGESDRPQILTTSTETLTDFEALGLLTACTELQSRLIQENFTGGDE